MERIKPYNAVARASFALPFWPRILALTVAGSLVDSANGLAQGKRPGNGTPDKSDYNLLHPTPREIMRELSTDRPDQTESPHTVDSGHFQAELDLVSAVFDSHEAGGGTVRTATWGTSLNLKVGLLNSVDMQFVIEPFMSERIRDSVARTVDETSGFGDVQTRLKINLWGNDGGKTAFAVMPFVKWPLPGSSLRNGRTEGGIIFPLSVELPAGWGMGLMTEFDFVSDEEGDYAVEYFNTATFGHHLVGNLSGYVEFAALAAPESDGSWLGQVDVGFTYGFDDNTQLDFGCNFGVTDSAPDYCPFVGFSFRF